MEKILSNNPIDGGSNTTDNNIVGNMIELETNLVIKEWKQSDEATAITLKR